tara:strand:+ start:11534 stop:11941 length:408 start_codon:yes stop_codon:yes gene_type:complete
MKKTILSLAILCTAVLASCEKKMNCTDFKTGTFLISKDTLFTNAPRLIKTATSQQQISSKGDTLFANVKWLNDCSYKLTFDKTKMMLSAFHINTNTRGGFLVEFGQPTGSIMPYISVIKGETKTETFHGFLKKVK